MASKGKSQGLTGILLLLSGVILGSFVSELTKGVKGLAVLRQQLRHRLPLPLYR